MNTKQAASFAMDLVRDAVTATAKSGHGSDAQFIYAVCSKLSSVLMLPLELVVEMFGKALDEQTA